MLVDFLLSSSAVRCRRRGINKIGYGMVRYVAYNNVYVPSDGGGIEFIPGTAQCLANINLLPPGGCVRVVCVVRGAKEKQRLYVICFRAMTLRRI